MSRPSWDETWSEVARTIALRSKCSRAQVGAVIVSAEQRIIATGYNGPPAHFVDPDVLSPDPDDTCDLWCVRGAVGPTDATITTYTDCPTIHAELNALLFVDRALCEGGTLYVTGEVCFSCAKAVANSGIKNVVIVYEVSDRSYRSPMQSRQLLARSGVSVRNG